MRTALQLLDSRGNPIMASTHYAAGHSASELAGWYPPTVSGDGEWLPDMEILRARTHDFIRNNGMVSGAIQTQIDNWIGAGLRLSAKPDWLALGITDMDYAAEWEDNTEAKFRQWSNDIDCYCDVSRQLSFGAMVAQACRSVLTSFEITATAEWLRRPGAKYATCLQMIDPIRLSNPHGQADGMPLPEHIQIRGLIPGAPRPAVRVRGGVGFDALGVPILYCFSSRVPSDPFQTINDGLLTWQAVMRESSWGRRMVIHVFDQERAGQTRGKGGIVSVLARGRMLDKNEQAHLQASLNNAMFSTVVESPMDWNQIGQAMGAGDPNDPVLKYLGDRVGFHKQSTIRFGENSRIAHLYPGEEIKHLSPAHPAANFDAFERVFHRYQAAGMNMTYEQYTRDYSQTNYSGHRAALLDYWRFVTGKRSNTAGKFASLGYALWLEEAMDGGEVETPPGAPSFLEEKTAWTRCDWIGPGRGQIDPLKEANATKVELQMGATNMEIVCAERGIDWRENVVQRAQEIRFINKIAAEHGIDAALLRGDGPTPVPQPPDEPEERRGKQNQEQPA